MNGVLKKIGKKPGKTIAIIGGVHGNERIGVDALHWARETISPDAGTVYFIEANLPAIEKNVRSIDKNLNRCFLSGNTGTTFEDIRARELMTILDECDASLDIHASNTREATPFITCESAGLPVAETLNFPIISTGWDALEPGTTDEYMNRNGKIGLCIECGSVYDAETVLPLAKESVLRFLRYFTVIGGDVLSADLPHKKLRARTVAHKGAEPLVFVKDFKDFEPLVAGEVFAREGDKEYRASEGDCIIFPRPNAKIGAEAFILGNYVQS